MSVFTHSERFHDCSCRPGATSQLRGHNGFYVTSNTKPLKDTELLHKGSSVLSGTWCCHAGAFTWPFGVCMDVRLECFCNVTRQLLLFFCSVEMVLTLRPTGSLPQQLQAKQAFHQLVTFAVFRAAHGCIMGAWYWTDSMVVWHFFPVASWGIEPKKPHSDQKGFSHTKKGWPETWNTVHNK